jgi:hypothetical protein
MPEAFSNRSYWRITTAFRSSLRPPTSSEETKMKLALSDAAAIAAASVIGRCGPSPSCRERVRRSAAPRNKICQPRTHVLLQPPLRLLSVPLLVHRPIPLRPGSAQAFLAVMLGSLRILGERRRPNYSSPTGIRLFKSGTAARPWERCCCAVESPTPVRRSLE